MCGIAGWVDVNIDLTNTKDIVSDMSKTLSHRGPDEKGTYLSGHAAFVHRRLTVIDPEGGKQPMVRYRGNNKYVLTYNGELYNTSELKSILQAKGYIFKESSDTEVLLLSYIEWKEQCVDYLNGIYAFAVWDENEKKIFIARDRFGVKPLFYALRGSSIVFSSEIKALFKHPDIQPEIDSEGLFEIFLLGPAHTPGNAVYKGISELKPAHSLSFDKSGLRINKYWALKSYHHEDNKQKTLDTIRELAVNAIERQLVSDVPLCTFLSGGLDSSAISAIASNNYRKKGHRLHTFSIDYVDNEKFFKANSFQPNSDADWVKLMSDKYNTTHHYIKFDTPQLVSSLENAVYAKDLPGMADIDSSLYLFCKEVKKHSTVALSGECADEIFGGYPWFHREELLNLHTFPWAPYLNERHSILSPELRRMLNLNGYVSKRYEETLDEVPRLENEGALEARRREIFYLNITWFMQTLLDRKDRMSMASGLEVRVPYCDHRLVQYAWNIPWDLKTYKGMEKGILRYALEDILPKQIVERKKSPYPKTHNPSYENAVRKKLIEILNDSSSPLIPLINKDSVISMAKGESDYGKPWFGQLMATPQLFAYLIQVNFWLKEYRVKIL